MFGHYSYDYDIMLSAETKDALDKLYQSIYNLSGPETKALVSYIKEMHQRDTFALVGCLPVPFLFVSKRMGRCDRLLIIVT